MLGELKGQTGRFDNPKIGDIGSHYYYQGGGVSRTPSGTTTRKTAWPDLTPRSDGGIGNNGT